MLPKTHARYIAGICAYPPKHAHAPVALLVLHRKRGATFADGAQNRSASSDYEQGGESSKVCAIIICPGLCTFTLFGPYGQYVYKFDTLDTVDSMADTSGCLADTSIGVGIKVQTRYLCVVSICVLYV